MLLPAIRPLLALFLLLPGSTASSNSSTDAVTGQAQPTTPSPEVKNHTSEPAARATAPTNLSLTSVAQTTTAKPSPTTPTLPVLTVQDDKTSENRSTAAPSSPPQDQEPTRRERPTTPVPQGASSSLSPRGTSEPVTPTLNSSDFLPEPTPTDDKSPLTVAAFGVISFIVILVVVVIILVSVVSLRFKCNRSKEEDKQKPGGSMVSERYRLDAKLEFLNLKAVSEQLISPSLPDSCSADRSQKDNSITLISMKNINMNNSLSYPPSEKVL